MLDSLIKMFVYKYVCMFVNGLTEPFVNILLKLLTNVFLELSYKHRSDNLIFFTALVRETKNDDNAAVFFKVFCMVKRYEQCF